MNMLMVGDKNSMPSCEYITPPHAVLTDNCKIPIRQFLSILRILPITDDFILYPLKNISFHDSFRFTCNLLIVMEQILCVDFVLYIIQHPIIPVGNDHIAARFEFLQIIDN